MGVPNKASKENPESSVYSEMISAESALNMPPDPIATEDSEHYYLSQMDGWAKHSLEHIRQAYRNMNEVTDKIKKLERENLKLRIKLAENEKKKI